jgi:tripartite-type tricarboxylate transporter receptor subunit TctC
VVQNIPGATGSIGLQRLVNIGTDGHAIGVLTGDTLTMAAFPQSPFKLSETVALGVMIRQPSGLFAKFDGPYKSWNDVIAAAKKKPINVAITGPNSPDEVTVNYLISKGINLVNIPYPKPAERYMAVLGGHVELLYEQAGDLKSHLEAKSLRPLIFFSSKRISAPFADIPVSPDFGYDILLPQTRSIIAKANVDPKRLEVISSSLEKFANTPEFSNYLRDQYAAPDSFIPMRSAQKFLENEVLSFQKINDSLPKNR